MEKKRDPRMDYALSLFDGNEEKAKTLLTLIDEREFKVPPEYENLKMQLPEHSCRWNTCKGECSFYMPDSLVECKGKCENYWGSI